MKTPNIKFLPLALLSISGIIFMYYSTVGSPIGFSYSFLDKTKYVNEALSNNLSNGYADGEEEMTYRLLTIDNSSKGVYRWPDDPLCSKYSVNFGKNMDGAWLMSYPRSGNTWTRYLIESATGFFTGSVYHANILKKLGYLGEVDRSDGFRTIVVKTHKIPPFKGSDRKTIIIIRNPERSIISFWNYFTYKRLPSHWTKSVANSSYTTRAFHRFVESGLKRWKSIYIYPLKNTKQLHIVFYEMLRENPLREIRGILRFLQLQPDEDRLLCLSRHLEGVAMGSQRKVEPYTLKEKNAFANATEEINVLLRSRGFPPLPDYQKYGLV